MTATSLRTADVPMHMVVSLLAPMFLAATGGDPEQARLAAIEIVRSSTARSPTDLLLIGQTIALGFATISSLSLSMAENIPINLVLRLRGNAVSLHRAGEQCRRALPEPDPAAASQQAPPFDTELEAEQAIVAEVIQTQQRAVELQPSLAAPAAPIPAVPAPATASEATILAADPDFPPMFPESLDAMKAAMARIAAESERCIGESAVTPTASVRTTPDGAPDDPATTAERILHAAWSSAMPHIARDLAGRPPAEPGLGGMRAAALGTTANQLISGTSSPSR